MSVDMGNVFIQGGMRIWRRAGLEGVGAAVRFMSWERLPNS